MKRLTIIFTTISFIVVSCTKNFTDNSNKTGIGGNPSIATVDYLKVTPVANNWIVTAAEFRLNITVKDTVNTQSLQLYYRDSLKTEIITPRSGNYFINDFIYDYALNSSKYYHFEFKMKNQPNIVLGRVDVE